MSRIARFAALTFAAALGLSQTLPVRAAAQDYPPAFPRAGATLLLDNEWGTAWDATYTPGQPTPMHRHPFDFVGVELTDSAVTVTAPDGTQRTIPEARGRTYFLPRGTTHIEEVPTGTPPRHTVIIDLKDLAPAARSASDTAFPDEAVRKVVENPRVILWDYSWSVKSPVAILAHHAFIVILDGGEQGVVFQPAGTPFPRAPMGVQGRAIVVELE